MARFRFPLRRAASAVVAAVAPLALVSPALLLLPALASADAPPAPSEAARAEAREVYAAVCVSCHGPAGRGDGLAAAGLPVRPVSFADPAWQKATSDAQIDKAIVDGGAAVGKSPLMPPNPSLRDKPQVLAALRDLIRSFAKEAPAAR